MTTGEFALELINMAGVPLTDDESRQFVERLQDIKQEVPVTISESVLKGITTPARATKDPEVVRVIANEINEGWKNTIKSQLVALGFENEEISPVFEENGKARDLTQVTQLAFSGLKAKEESRSKLNETDLIKLTKETAERQVREANLKLQAEIAAREEEKRRHQSEVLSRDIKSTVMEFEPRLPPITAKNSVREIKEQAEARGWKIVFAPDGVPELWEADGTSLAKKQDGGVYPYKEFALSIINSFGAVSGNTGFKNPEKREPATNGGDRNLPDKKRLAPGGKSYLEEIAEKTGARR